MKNSTPTKSPCLSDASFEEFTPPDERRLPVLAGRLRVSVEPHSLDESGLGKNGSVVSVSSLVQTTPISSQTGVSKSSVELLAIKNIDDIVVAAAARAEPRTPESKVVSPENVIPTGKQLARTPYIKGCANSGDNSLQDSFQGDLSAATNPGLSSDTSERGTTSTSSGSALEQATTSIRSETVEKVADSTQVVPASNEKSNSESDLSEVAATSRRGTSRSKAQEAAPKVSQTRGGRGAKASSLSTDQPDGTAQGAVQAPVAAQTPQQTDPSNCQDMFKAQEDAKAGSLPKKRLVLSKKTSAVIEPTVATSAKGRRGRKAAAEAEADLAHLEAARVPAVSSDRQPARRSTRGATSSSAAAAATTSSASTSSAVSTSVKSVAKEKKVLPARVGARKLETIVEGLDETVREAVDPIVSPASLVSIIACNLWFF